MQSCPSNRTSGSRGLSSSCSLSFPKHHPVPAKSDGTCGTYPSFRCLGSEHLRESRPPSPGCATSFPNVPGGNRCTTSHHRWCHLCTPSAENGTPPVTRWRMPDRKLPKLVSAQFRANLSGLKRCFH